MSTQVADNQKLLALWDAEKNTQNPTAVPERSYRSVWWRCPKKHSFERAPRLMLRDSSCPGCQSGTTSLAATHPALVKLWDADKNGDLTAATVDSGHVDSVWWICADGHGFGRSPLQMSRDSSCPHCALAESSLAARFPAVAAEWHPDKNGEILPGAVDPDHIMSVWWRCSKGHEFQQSVRKRTRGHGRCPECFGAWSVDNIRKFVRSLLIHIDAFIPSEMFAFAMQAGVLKNKNSRAFVMALSSGRFPMAELEKFTEGQPSLVDEFAANEALTLENVQADRGSGTPSADDAFTLPAAPTEDEEPDNVELDVSGQVDLTGQLEEDEDDLPVIKTRDALAALDSALVASADAETVRFLLDSAKAKLWRHAYSDEAEARRQAEQFKGDNYSTAVRDLFLAELTEASSLERPKGYSFRPRPGAAIADPHLMQKHVAVEVLNKRRYGNWSGMGAGKTLSALLATRVVGADLTVICCPNSVVKNWKKEIENAFPGCDIATKTWSPSWTGVLEDKPRYLIMNYEQFQQGDSEEHLVSFVDRNVVDAIVIDEIHFAKQRHAKTMSRRKRLVQGLILESGKKNAELCVLGMSGTPVINELQEGRSLVELVTGHRHDDLETKATVQNCMRLYQKFVTLGTRWKPNYATQLDESNRPEIDCADNLDELRAVGRGTVLELEQVLTRIRIPSILENIKAGEKALVYTYYVDGIVDQLRDAIRDAGFRVGLFTGGQDDTDLNEFLEENGQVDVLIASSRVSTGVDGLQHVCNKLIINCLPWTNAEYEQLRARIWRQGSRFERVEVVVPVTYAMVNGERWSYCESKLNRLHYKKSIADAAVDGVVPEGNLRTAHQAQQDIMGWLSRLDGGELENIVRPAIEVPLSRAPSDVARRVRAYGDFTKVNNRWYQSSSAKTHQRLSASPEEWAHYHTMYKELREDWPIVPFKEEIRWLKKREGWVVGDFGCGEALISLEVGDKHLVHSFDHVAINNSVVACDIRDVPLDDEALDLAVFCLALMGANFTDYIREAHRCLRLDGMLHIWEPASYLEDVEKFCDGLAKLGFDVMAPHKQGAFMQIRAMKNANAPAPELQLHFRGR